MSGGKACPKCKQFFTWSEYFGHEPMCGQFDKYLQTDTKAQEQARLEKEAKILAEVQSALSANQQKEAKPVQPSYKPQADYQAYVKPAPERELTGLEKARSQQAVKQKVQEEQEVVSLALPVRTPSARSNPQYKAELAKLQEMFDAGFIQDFEFEKRKTELADQYK